MRRVLMPLTALGLLGLALGCSTTRHESCNCGSSPVAGPLHPVPAPHPAPLLHGPASPHIPPDGKKVPDMADPDTKPGDQLPGKKGPGAP